MNYGKSDFGFLLSVCCIVLFGFLVTFSFADYAVTVSDGAAFFQSFSHEELYKFCFLAFYYGSLFVFSQLACGLVFVVGWLVNCVCIHIQYRKPQRVYTPKT